LHENWVQEMGDKMVYVHGCVLYDDIFKQRHWLTFCHRWRNEIPAFENCEAGNDTGDGNGPK
jgi:hypothetical protein